MSLARFELAPLAPEANTLSIELQGHELTSGFYHELSIDCCSKSGVWINITDLNKIEFSLIVSFCSFPVRVTRG